MVTDCLANGFRVSAQQPELESGLGDPLLYSRRQRSPPKQVAEQFVDDCSNHDRLGKVGAAEFVEIVDPRTLDPFTDVSHVDNKRWFDDNPCVCGGGVSALPLVIVPGNVVRRQLHPRGKNRRRFDPITPQRERGDRAVTMAVAQAERDLCEIGLAVLGCYSPLLADTGDRPPNVHEIINATSRKNAVGQNRCIFHFGPRAYLDGRTQLERPAD